MCVCVHSICTIQHYVCIQTYVRVWTPQWKPLHPLCSCPGYWPRSMSTLPRTTCIELEPVDNTRLFNVFAMSHLHIWRQILAVPTTRSFSVTPYEFWNLKFQHVTFPLQRTNECLCVMGSRFEY